MKDDTGAKKKKRSKSFLQYLFMIVYMLIGAVCGVLIAIAADKISTNNSDTGYLFTLLLLFAGMYVAMFLQTVIHESGHLIFGLLTGYRFLSFRVGSFMLLKKDKKLRFCRMSLAGTGGQCLLAPPALENGTFPYVLYNLGGALVNLISAVLFAGVAVLCRDLHILSTFLMMNTVFGIIFAITNGIPMRLGTIDNDGYNILSIGKTPESLRSFWLQMEINRLSTEGVRLKDMPEEWFHMPSEESMKNSMTAVMGVFACNRLMDEQKFAEADNIMETLLTMDIKLAGLYRSLMVNDQIYCELVGSRREERLNLLLDKQQKKFMKAMKNFPSVLRTEYAYALLLEKDSIKADDVLKRFEKMVRTYPNPSDIESERELMRYVERFVDVE